MFLKVTLFKIILESLAYIPEPYDDNPSVKIRLFIVRLHWVTRSILAWLDPSTAYPFPLITSSLLFIVIPSEYLPSAVSL